ncbi:MAG TPA: DUF6640 family protein [Chthoniobacterales bacterium]
MKATTRRNSVIGRCLLSLVAAVSIGGSFLADWNNTHIYKPNWPPHAKFHNGQTMAVGVLLGRAAAFFTWRRKGDARTNLMAAAMFASFYWVSQAMAFLFPGVTWTGPNLLKPGESLHPAVPLRAKLDLVLITPVILAVALLWRTTGTQPGERR